MWKAPRDTKSRALHEKEDDPRTKPKKDPDEADKKPRTSVGELDIEEINPGDETKKSLGGTHVFYKTRYGSEDLLGMNTKVSTVEGTQGGKQQTIQALADSGASASIISWDLANNINMEIYEKGDATLKDASHKHMDVSGQGEIIVQEEHGLPHKIQVLV